ncbi:MAG: SpoIID/LytB domain-containing protein [Anaeromyxobacter sp.]|nr:SpoIID/LytB domain-containing protein [Anaeromyxobacter sp.]
MIRPGRALALPLLVLALACATVTEASREVPAPVAASSPAAVPPHPGPLPQQAGGEGVQGAATPTPTSTATPTPTPTPTPTATATSTAVPPHPGPLPQQAGGEGVQGAATPPVPSFLPPGILSNLPPPLPPPDPPPDLTPLPTSLEQADPLELLWSHRLELGPGGQPLVTIRITEGQQALSLRPLGPARLSLRGGGVLELPAGAALTFRLRHAAPARLDHAPLLGEAVRADRAGLEPARREWTGRGVALRTRLVGGVYGLGGRVVDNRRELLLAAGDGSRAGAAAQAADLEARAGQRVPLHAELVERPRGTLQVFGEAGLLGEADLVAALDVAGDAGAAVEAVAHGLDGRAAREDRRYRGRLLVTVDAGGALALVNLLPLEALLRGLVPSEMPAGSPLEALKAQAVTARSNVLAQIGTRHLGDPYLLCAEVHCQAYRGTGAETLRTDEAVRATAGEALFGRADRTLVDGVYSAMCGGHGEDAHLVWGGGPRPGLGGHPDLPAALQPIWGGGLRDESRLRDFLAAPPDAWCARPAAARRDRFRWERRFAPADLDGLAAPLGVGRVRGLAPLARGVSGRVLTLRVEGELADAEVRGELTIRRLLKNLPSSMFVVDREGAETVLRGGGWGHGAGMCQWGAIGRAEAGQDYRRILEASFEGAEVGRIH